jgi:hypothetical protein
MQARSYSSLSPAQLSYEMTNLNLIQGSQKWNDMEMLNPKLAQDVINLRNVNNSQSNIFTKNPDGTTTNNLESQTAQDWMTQFSNLFKVSTLDEIKNAVRTEDVIVKEGEMKVVEEKMNKLTDAMEAISSDVDKEMV